MLSGACSAWTAKRCAEVPWPNQARLEWKWTILKFPSPWAVFLLTWLLNQYREKKTSHKYKKWQAPLLDCHHIISNSFTNSNFNKRKSHLLRFNRKSKKHQRRWQQIAPTLTSHSKKRHQLPYDKKASLRPHENKRTTQEVTKASGPSMLNRRQPYSQVSLIRIAQNIFQVSNAIWKGGHPRCQQKRHLGFSIYLLCSSLSEYM